MISNLSNSFFLYKPFQSFSIFQSKIKIIFLFPLFFKLLIYCISFVVISKLINFFMILLPVLLILSSLSSLCKYCIFKFLIILIFERFIKGFFEFLGNIDKLICLIQICKLIFKSFKVEIIMKSTNLSYIKSFKVFTIMLQYLSNLYGISLLSRLC